MRRMMKRKNVTTSYSQIARKTGLSVSFISRVMRGKREPSMSSLIIIADAMGITTDKLVGVLRNGRTDDGNEGDKTKSGEEAGSGGE